MTLNYHTRVIIGGAPSTGSSLLRRILHRHTSIFSGDETHLFSKSELYHDWNQSKSKLFNRAFTGLRSAGWHNYTGVRLDELGWSHNELNDLIVSNNNFPSFADQLYAKVLTDKQSNTWVEKTPSNAYCLIDFLQYFDGKVIHIVRDPLDNIASMVNRGDSVYTAVCHYLLNNAFALRTKDHPAQLLVRYESLVSQPSKTVAAICDFLALKFEESMLESSQADAQSTSTMKGWEYDETADVGQASVGKFERLPVNLQSDILAAIYQIRIKKAFGDRAGLMALNVEGLNKMTDYSIPPKPNKKLFLHSAKATDIAFRTHRWYPYHIFNYPIEF